ncbi:MAG: hypothetical protein KDM81_05075 [Verrucomicrobiae bacterium]|nr:hypothetical protein [Verrucomicrobiae bacterium]MCP5522336.1 hypothetical protein [Verrucomicrobiales bacterium]
MGPAPHSPVLGDPNHDGAPDLIVANPGLDETGRSISALFGRSDGTLSGRTSTTHLYVEGELEIKRRTEERITPPRTCRRASRTTDLLLRVLKHGRSC